MIVTTNSNPFQLVKKQGGPLWRGGGEVGVCLKKKKKEQLDFNDASSREGRYRMYVLVRKMKPDKLSFSHL